MSTTLFAAAGSNDRWAGRTLVQVLNGAVRSGLQIVYSESLVLPHLTVRREPRAHDPLVRVREVLAAHGLTLQRAGGDVWVVVRDERDAVETTATTPGPLSEVTLTSSRYSLVADAPQPSLSLAAADADSQPALVEDAMRAVRRFPGTAGTALSSRSYVRGGDDIENLVLLEGVPIVDAFHFEGNARRETKELLPILPFVTVAWEF